MAEHILFLTGHLAQASLCRELEGLAKRDFSYQVHNLGIKVAALMSSDLILRRLPRELLAAHGVTKILVPGLCVGSLARLSEAFGVPVERGPKDLKDLAEFFGTQGRQTDLSQYRVKIFAEIVDAPQRSVASILERAERYRQDGADVIDLGCLPETPFPLLEEAIAALQAQGFAVSVDSLESDDLLRAGRAGADYLLSLRPSTLWIAAEVAATPILIPETPGDLDSLCRACEQLLAQNKPFYADAVLDPLHFGFTDAIARYRELRQRLPQVPILFGIGNVTELTDADTTGMTALLMGIASELELDAVLTTEVSPHCASAVRETDLARRVMRAAKDDGRLPRGYHSGLMALRDRKPFPYAEAEIAATAAAVKDANYRIQTSAEGIHLYNRDGRYCATDPYALYPKVETQLAADSGHAFYLGVELARAQIAWQLGKRYWQDKPLQWGCAEQSAPLDSQPEQGFQAAGSTRRRPGRTKQ